MRPAFPPCNPQDGPTKAGDAKAGPNLTKEELGMATSELSTTRRNVLTGIVAVSAAGATGGAIAFPAGPAAYSGEWYALKARYDAKLSEEAAFNRDFHDPAFEEYHRHVKRPALWYSITAKNGQVATYKVSPDDDFATIPFPRFEAEAARIRKEWHAYKIADAKWRERLNITAIRDRSDKLGDERHSLEKALIQLPAPDLPALLWKIENLWGCSVEQKAESCDSIGMDWVTPVIKDARRLLGGADAEWLTRGRA